MPELLSASGEPIHHEIRLSNLNIPPGEIAVAGLGQLTNLRDDLARGEHGVAVPGGFDVTPTRVLAAQAILGKCADYPELVSGVHQAWPKPLLAGFRGESTWRGGAFNAAAYAIMPDSIRSLPTLRRIIDQLGNVTLCGYPESLNGHNKPIDFSAFTALSGAQIQRESFDKLRIDAEQPDAFDLLHATLRARGMHGIFYDGHHALSGGLPAHGMIDSIRRQGTPIVGIHFAAGRTDAKRPEDRERSMADLAAVFEGPEAVAQTNFGNILRQAYQIACNQRQRVMLPQARMDEEHTAQQRVYERYEDDVEMTTLISALAADPTERDYRLDSQKLHALATDPRWGKVVPVTLEVPHAALVRYRQEHGGPHHLSRADTLAMTRDLVTSADEFFLAA